MAKSNLTFRPGFSAAGRISAANGSVNKIEASNTYKIDYLPLDSIRPNSLNERYKQNDLESLSFSIEDRGLLHNLVVRPAETDGQYVLVSGERRWRAISMIKDRNPQRFSELFPGGLVPAKIHRCESDIDEEIDLIVANSQSRTLSTVERFEDVRRLSELYAAKTSGAKTSARARAEAVAADLGMTWRQAYKYISMEKLLPQFADAFKEGRMGLELAGKVASLTESQQLLLLERVDATALKIVIPKEVISAVKKNCKVVRYKTSGPTKAAAAIDSVTSAILSGKVLPEDELSRLLSSCESFIAAVKEKAGE